MNDQITEVTDCVAEILSPCNNSDRLKAAQRLAEFGVRFRRSTLPRGTADTAARGILPDSQHEQSLISVLNNTDGELRRQIILALGQWGSDHAARAIKDILTTSENIDDQYFCITALEAIGGPIAIIALRCAAANSALKHAANFSLHQLQTGGTWDLSEGNSIRGRSLTNATIHKTIDLN